MHISVRSHMAVGAAVAVGATAVAMTPIAPTVPLPTLSTANTEVAMAAMDSPAAALMQTGQLGFNFLFTNGYSTDPVTNWGDSGIGETWNALLPQVHDDFWGFLPHITSVGLIPNLTQVPAPIRRQLMSNWTGYLNAGDQATVRRDITANATAFFGALQAAIPELTRIASYHADILSAATRNVIGAITSAIGAGDVQGAWNAAVAGLLSPTGIPGTLLNLTIGAGVQTNTDDQTTFIASVRTALQTTREALASALSSATPPAAGVLAARTAPVVTAPAAAAASAVENTKDAVSAPRGTAVTGDSPAGNATSVPTAPTKRLGRHAADAGAGGAAASVAGPSAESSGPASSAPTKRTGRTAAAKAAAAGHVSG